MLTAKRRYTGVRKQGIKYEQAALQYLQHRYGSLFIPQPWFCYQESRETRVRYCQPDGLLYSPDLSTITIVEIKLKHTETAWWQLRHKYGPLLREVFPRVELRYVEVVKWYDVSIPFPEPVDLRGDISHATRENIQVTIWKP